MTIDELTADEMLQLARKVKEWRVSDEYGWKYKGYVDDFEVLLRGGIIFRYAEMEIRYQGSELGGKLSGRGDVLRLYDEVDRFFTERRKEKEIRGLKKIRELLLS